MTTPNDGGPAFPMPAHQGSTGEQLCQLYGMSIRAWLAAHETLADCDQPDVSVSNELCEALAGPKPEGGWISGNMVAMYQWEAKWRAALKLMRADALLAALQEQSK